MVTFNDADDFFETSAQGGNAYRFKDIDGIGPATADKIKDVRGVQNPEDVADMSADELSDKAGISHSRATKAIKGGGGNPNVSKESNTGSVSAAGITMPVGDFRVEAGDQDKARARNDTFTRSEEAIRQDDRKRAPITTDLEKWKNNKSKYDFPGVDTPTQDPKALPKDYKAGDPRTTEVDEETEVATGNPSGFAMYPEAAAGGSSADPFMAELPARDVSLSPDEAFRGVGAVGVAENDKYPNIPVQDRGGRYDADPIEEQEEIDEIAAEQSRSEQQAETGNGKEQYDLSDTTLAQLRTALNKRTDDYFDIYDPAKADRFESIRQRISIGDSIELDYDEYRMVERVLREEKEDAEDRAERMERNIYGDTDEQAERARGAFRDLRNNPPSDFY